MKYYSDTDKQVNFLCEALGFKTDSYILDLGCGDGYQLTKLQQTFPNTFGIDKEPHFNLKNFTQSNIFENKLPENCFNSVFCLSPYFGSNWWNLDFLLESISKSLKVGGSFGIDLFSQYLAL